MKKRMILILALVVGFFSTLAYAESGEVYTRTMFDSEAFAAGVAEYSKDSAGNAIVINLNDYKPDGYFTVQVYLDDADGSMTLEWEVSHDGVHFSEPWDENGVIVPDILTSFAFNHGNDTDGRVFLAIPKPIYGKYARLKATPSAHAITGFTVILGVR